MIYILGDFVYIMSKENDAKMLTATNTDTLEMSGRTADVDGQLWTFKQNSFINKLNKTILPGPLGMLIIVIIVIIKGKMSNRDHVAKYHHVYK